MSMTKRTQGRPPRNSGMNGREKLIEATRAYLQSNRKMTLTRTEIAQGCGVTPALISYYFKDKRSLLDAVIKPVLKTYRQQLTELIGSQCSPRERMLRIIRLLIQMNMDDAFLVEFMLRQESLEELDSEDRSSVGAFQASIAVVVRERIETGAWRNSDPVLAELALWGLCRAVGDALRSGAEAEDGALSRLALAKERAAFVYGMFEAPAGTVASAAAQDVA